MSAAMVGIRSVKVTCKGIAKRRRERIGCMARIVGIVCAFGNLGKSGNALIRAQGLELFAPPRQELVGVRLMADVENETVTGAVKHAMKRDDELDATKRWRKVSAMQRRRRYHLGAQLEGQTIKLLIA